MNNYDITSVVSNATSAHLVISLKDEELARFSASVTPITYNMKRLMGNEKVMILGHRKKVTCRESVTSYLESFSVRSALYKDAGYEEYHFVTCKGELDVQGAELLNSMVIRGLRDILGDTESTFCSIYLNADKQIELRFSNDDEINTWSLSATLLAIRMISTMKKVTGSLDCYKNKDAFAVSVMENMEAIKRVITEDYYGMNRSSLALAMAFILEPEEKFWPTGFLTRWGSNGPANFAYRFFTPQHWLEIESKMPEKSRGLFRQYIPDDRSASIAFLRKHKIS